MRSLPLLAGQQLPLDRWVQREGSEGQAQGSAGRGDRFAGGHPRCRWLRHAIRHGPIRVHQPRRQEVEVDQAATAGRRDRALPGPGSRVAGWRGRHHRGLPDEHPGHVGQRRPHDVGGGPAAGRGGHVGEDRGRRRHPHWSPARAVQGPDEHHVLVIDRWGRLDPGERAGRRGRRGAGRIPDRCHGRGRRPDSRPRGTVC